MKDEKSKMMGERAKIWIGFFIICTVWGTTWLAIKIGLETVPPFLAAGVRFAVAAFLLGIIVKLRGLPIPVTQDAKKLYLSLGLLSFSIPFALAYWGQQFVPTGLSSILFGAYPFWVAIFSHLLLKDDRVDPLKLAGIALGFCGVFIIFYADFRWSEDRALWGMSAILASTVLQGFGLVLVKKYGQPVSPFVMNFVGMLIGMVLLLTLGFLVEAGKPVTWNMPAVLSVLYLAVVGSVLTFVTYYWLLKRIDPVYLSLSSFINPIVAVMLGAAVLGERLPPTVVAGAVLVLLGILIANGKSLYAKLYPSA